MKILLAHNHYRQRGGEDAVVESESALLRTGGHDVFSFDVHSRSIRSVAQKIGAFTQATYNRRAKRAFAARLAEVRPDVVHVHNFFPLLSPSIFDACREAGVPSVMTLHNYRILCPTSILYHDGHVIERSLHRSSWWTVPRRVYNNSIFGTWALANMVETHKRRGTWRGKVDRFVALTEFAKAKLIEGGLPAERIVVKPNAIAAPPLPAELPPRRGALFVGRLSAEKGLETLLQAWRGSDYPLRVAGDGPLGATLDRDANNVTFLGRLPGDAVRAEMLRAAFLVFPSGCYETFGVSIIEAFSCGLPVIVSRLGGQAEIVADGATGLQFAPGDTGDLAAKVRWAIEHPAEMARFGLAARAEYEHRYTPEINMHNLLRIYREAIAAHHIKT